MPADREAHHPQISPSAISSTAKAGRSGLSKARRATLPSMTRRLIDISPSIAATTTLPCPALRLRSTTARSRSKMPAPRMLSPEMFQAKVAGGFGASQRGSSRAPSRKSSAGEGKPAQSALAEDRNVDKRLRARGQFADPIDAHGSPRYKNKKRTNSMGGPGSICWRRVKCRACACLWTERKKANAGRALPLPLHRW